MNRLDPDKLTIRYQDNITPTAPIIPRRYTLTHSDQTAELFLTIADDYAYEELTPMRDEVLGEWKVNNDDYIFWAAVYVDGNGGLIQAAIRNKIFIRELPLALKAIRYGDNSLFQAHPELDTAPLCIYFQSKYPKFDRVEDWGTLGDYK